MMVMRWARFWFARVAEAFAGVGAFEAACRELPSGQPPTFMPKEPEPDRPPLSNARWTGLRCMACRCKLYADCLHPLSTFLCAACDERAAARPLGPWAAVRKRERDERAVALAAATDPGEAPG
jgi:hypothetical protein